MTTKTDRDLDEELGPSPWPLFADEEEPWKDHERILKLNDKFDYQYEIAHVLGCSTSQASYWLEKAEEAWAPDLSGSDHECRYFEVCGYSTWEPDGICDTCLDLVRHNDSRRGLDPEEGADLTAHMESLYDEYDQFERNSP